MQAIVDINGRQYQVEQGRYLEVDNMNLEPGASVELDQVYFIAGSEGKASLFGQPFIKGAKIKATVLKNVKARKIIVFKMRCKKGYRRKQGHRQQLTLLQIESIEA
jgi:large subunit ribosomal protein L21